MYNGQTEMNGNFLQKAREQRVYVGYETARMAELDGTPLASFSSRAVAFAIDMALSIVSFVVIALAVGLAAYKLGWHGGKVHFVFDPFHIGKSHEDASSWVSLVYYIAFVALSNYLGGGATIGKRAMKIRAVSLVHHKLSLWHSVERALGYGASALEGFFGFFQYFVHPNRRTVHDRIAETIVVSERKPKQIAKGVPD